MARKVGPFVCLAFALSGVLAMSTVEACAPWIQFGDGVILTSAGSATPATLLLNTICEGDGEIVLKRLDRPSLTISVHITTVGVSSPCLMIECGFGTPPGGYFAIRSDDGRIDLHGYAAPSTQFSSVWTAAGTVDGQSAAFFANAAVGIYASLPQ